MEALKALIPIINKTASYNQEDFGLNSLAESASYNDWFQAFKGLFSFYVTKRPPELDPDMPKVLRLSLGEITRSSGTPNLESLLMDPFIVASCSLLFKYDARVHDDWPGNWFLKEMGRYSGEEEGDYEPTSEEWSELLVTAMIRNVSELQPAVKNPAETLKWLQAYSEFLEELKRSSAEKKGSLIVSAFLAAVDVFFVMTDYKKFTIEVSELRLDSCF